MIVKIFKFTLVSALLVCGFILLKESLKSNAPWILFYYAGKNGKINLKVSNQELASQGVIIESQINVPPSFNGKIVIFDRKITELPFGSLEFQDITAIPGRVKFIFEGKNIELLKRVFIIDGNEKSWGSVNGERISP